MPSRLERYRAAAPRWLARAALSLLAVAVVAAGLQLAERPRGAIGQPDGESWSTSLGTEPSFRFSNVEPGRVPMEVVASAGDVYVVAGSTVSAYAADRGERRWQRALPTPRSPDVAGSVLVVDTPRGVVALDRSTGEVEWEHGSPGPAHTVTGDGTVYQTDGTGITALSAVDGRVRWSRPSPRGTPTGPVIAEGSMLLVLEGETILGLSGADGEVRWEYPLPGPLRPPPGVGDGDVYLEPEPGLLLALDIATGEERWRTTAPGEAGQIAATDHGVVRWSRSGDAIAYGYATGRQLWSRTIEASFPWLHGTDTIYLARRAPGRVEAIDARSGTVRWSRSRPPAGMVAADEDHLYLAQQDTLTAWDASDGTERWRIHPQDPEGLPGFPSPVLDGGQVLVTTIGGPLTSLDRVTGEERWRLDPADIEDELPTEAPSGLTSIALGLGDDLVVASNRAIYRVDARSGDVLAAFPTNVAPGAVPVLAGGHVVIDLGPSLVALDRDDLRLRWQYTAPSASGRIGAHAVTAPTVHGEVVLVGSEAGTLAALDPDDGSPVWDLDLGAAIVSRPVVHDGVIVLRTESGDVRAFEAATGRARWRQDVSSTGVREPAAGSGSVYVSDGPQLIALDLGTGVERWRTDPGGGALTAPTVHGEVVHVGTADGEVVAIDGGSGAVVWRFDAGAPLRSPPTIVDGELVVVTEEGTVLSLR